MLYVTRYSIRGERTKERIGALMSLFGERGEIPGTIAHYTAIDGTGGYLIIESDDQATLYQATLAYQEWLDLATTPIMTIEDAVPHLLASLE
jgi:hypothetical protein